MDEKRLRELETWTLEDRDGLTQSENVLLDAIGEACLDIRESQRAAEAMRQEIERLREELVKDRHVMEGLDLELAAPEPPSLDRARALVFERLEEHARLAGEGPAPPPANAAAPEPS